MTCLVSLNRVLALADPIEMPPWECASLLTKQMVFDALDEGLYHSSPVPEKDYPNPYCHAERIAWLVANGWDDAIEIDVGIPFLGFSPTWPVLDGNHRLYAAAIRGDETILIDVAGDLDYASELFGVEANALVNDAGFQADENP